MPGAISPTPSAMMARPLVIWPSWLSCPVASPPMPSSDWNAVSMAPRPIFFITLTGFCPSKRPPSNMLPASKRATGIAFLSANSRATCILSGSCSAADSACGSFMGTPASSSERRMPSLASNARLAENAAWVNPARAPTAAPGIAPMPATGAPAAVPAAVPTIRLAGPLSIICSPKETSDSVRSSPITETGLLTNAFQLSAGVRSSFIAAIYSGDGMTSRMADWSSMTRFASGCSCESSVARRLWR